jgi:hypothetical protein
MRLGTIVKQPRERISISINYRDALDASDILALINAVTVAPATGTTPLTVEPSLASEDRLRIWLNAGDDGEQYTVTARVTTAGGEILEDEVIVRILEV